MDLILRIKADNEASKSLKDIGKDIEGIKKQIQDAKKEASNVNLDLKGQEKAKAKLEELETELKKLEQSAVIKLDTKELEKASQTFQHVGDVAGRASLVLGGFTAGLGAIGYSLIDAASNAQKYGIAMTTAFQGNQEAADKMLSWAKQFANETPFETNEVVDATIKLKSYGVEAAKIPDTLKSIGNMAAGMGKGLNQAVEAFADASTGELERLKEFGITKAMLDEQMGGSLVNAQGQIKDTGMLLESLTQIMEERFAGATDKMATSFEGMASNLRGELTGLKEELGAELLPTVTEFVKKGTDIVKWFRELPPETKKSVVSLGETAFALGAIGTAMTGTIAFAAPAIASIMSITAQMGGLADISAKVTTTLGVTGTAIATTTAIAGGLAIAIGIVGTALIEYWKACEQIKQQKIEETLGKQAETVKNLNKAFGETNQGGVTLFQDLIKDMNSADFGKSTADLNKMSAGLDFANQQIKLFNERKQELEAGANEGNQFNWQEISKVNNSIKSYQLAIDKINEFKKAQSDKALYENTVNTFSELNKVFTDISKWKFEIDDKSLKELLKTQEQNITALEELKNKYKLTKEQELEVDEKIKIAREKIIKEQADAEKKRYEEFLASQKLALTQGLITEQEYYTSILNYSTNNKDLKLKNEQIYYDGISKLQKEELAREKALQEERFKAYQKINENIIALEDDKAKKIELEYNNQLQRIESEKAYYNQLGIDKNSIDTWYYAEVDKLATDTADKKRQLDEEELARKQEIQQKIIELEKGSNSTEGLQEKYKIQQEINNSIRDQAEALLLRFKSGQDLNENESQLLNKYLDGKKALNDINSEIQDTNKKLQESFINSNSLKTSFQESGDATESVKDNTAEISNNIRSATEETKKLSAEMQTYGNITASKNPFGEMGNFYNEPGGLGTYSLNPGPLPQGNQGAGLQGNVPNSITPNYYQSNNNAWGGVFAGFLNSLGSSGASMSSVGSPNITNNSRTQNLTTNNSQTFSITNDSNTPQNVKEATKTVMSYAMAQKYTGRSRL